jgi:hypothetical protein
MYENWKILKSQIAEKADEYSAVADWCNENGYTIVEDGKYYKTVKLPEPTPLTDEEIRQMRIDYRRGHIDDQTAERSRKMANGTWTDEDEQAYLALDAEVTTYIEEHYPYNEV